MRRIGRRLEDEDADEDEGEDDKDEKMIKYKKRRRLPADPSTGGKFTAGESSRRCAVRSSTFEADVSGSLLPG